VQHKTKKRNEQWRRQCRDAAYDCLRGQFPDKEWFLTEFWKNGFMIWDSDDGRFQATIKEGKADTLDVYEKEEKTA
jgi:hypothetical protein